MTINIIDSIKEEEAEQIKKKAINESRQMADARKKAENI